MTLSKWKINYDNNGELGFIISDDENEPNFFQAAEILQKELLPKHTGIVHVPGSHRMASLELIKRNGILITSIEAFK